MDVRFETKHGNRGGKDEWLTPPEIIKSLGEFDLDPCSPIDRPWDTAKTHYTKIDNGLKKEWFGRVWCNPPYGRDAAWWLKKCSEHKNVTALIFARTETKMFFNYIWNNAKAVLFIKGRLSFYHISGFQGQSAGAPSVLIAYDDYNAEMLKSSNIIGKFLIIN